MTNDDFKLLYNNTLRHGWVTSSDSTKAAKQRAREKEYNARYYREHKEKWSALKKAPKTVYDKPAGPKNKISNEYLMELASNSKKNNFVSVEEGKKIFSDTIPVPDQKPFILKNPIARGIGKLMDNFTENYSIGIKTIQQTAKKTIDSGKRFIDNIRDDVKFVKEVYSNIRPAVNEAKRQIRSLMNEQAIKHEGTKGMRWGIRRFQNPDGSLTPLGRLHYGVGQAKKDYKNKLKEPGADKKKLTEEYKAGVSKIKAKMKKEKEKEDKKKAEEAAKEKERQEEEKRRREAEAERAEKDRIIKSGDANLVMQNRDKLSTQELQQAAARIEIESRINNYSKSSKQDRPQVKQEKKDLGRDFIDKMRQADSDMKTLGSTYNTLANIANTIVGEDKYRLVPGMGGGKK